MTEKTADSFWKEIEKRKVSPIPIWRFHLKNYGLWLLVVLFGLFASLATSTVYYVLFSHDLDVEQGRSSDFIDWSLVLHILHSIPYLWITIVVTVILIALYLARSSRKGYQYSIRQVTAISLLSVVIFSLLFSFFDVGKYMHRYLSMRVNAYNYIVHSNEQQWSQPEKGYLGGKIMQSYGSDRMLVIRDFHGFEWMIDTTNTVVKEGTHFSSGYYVKIRGVQTGEANFRATTIQEWDETDHDQ